MKEIFVRNKWYGVVFLTILVFTLASCERLLFGEPGTGSVGFGNTIILIIIGVPLLSIASFIVGGLGSLLGLIPVIGIIFKILIGIAIVLAWVLFFIALAYTYGLIALILGIIATIIIAGFTGGGPVYGILILFK